MQEQTFGLALWLWLLLAPTALAVIELSKLGKLPTRRPDDAERRL